MTNNEDLYQDGLRELGARLGLDALPGVIRRRRVPPGPDTRCRFYW